MQVRSFSFLLQNGINFALLANVVIIVIIFLIKFLNTVGVDCTMPIYGFRQGC